MIDQTLPLPELTAGMARCVREWILPHLEDPMARLQAEQLATLLDALPGWLAPSEAAKIRADSDAARALLERMDPGGLPERADGWIDDLMRENSALKRRLEELAARLRRSEEPGDAKRLQELQRFFIASAIREVDEAALEGSDFATMTSKDSDARKK